MTMATHATPTDLAMLGEDNDNIQVDTAAVALLNRSEVECQIDAAHKHRRSINRFLLDARTLATLDRDTAESCIYSLPRAGKVITGPSVRLAEICASAYGNLHIGARVLDIEEREIVGQGVCWDLERNLRVSVEARRRITKKNGDRYDDDMINVAGAAAVSIALRNAVFRVIPRTYINQVYEKVKEVAVGTLATLEQSRDAVLSRLNKAGVTTERILARVGKASAVDVGAVEIEQLIGLWSAMKDGLSPDEAFPAAVPAVAPAPPGAAQEGRKVSLRGKGKGAAATPQGAPPEAQATPSATPPAPDPNAPTFGTPAQGEPPRGPTPAGTTPEAHEAARRAHAANGGKGAGPAPAPAGAPAASKETAGTPDWGTEAQMLWDRATQATTTADLGVIAEEVSGYEEAGAPAKLVNPLRAHLAARREALKGSP